MPSSKKTAVAVPKRTPAPATPLPPIAVAIARMVEPNMDRVNDNFVRAWAAMPAIVAAFAAGKNDSIDTVNAGGLISDMVEEYLAACRSKGVLNQNAAKAYDALEATDPDSLLDLRCAFTEPAFNVGLALGVYMALNGGAR
jgi:hypothetical protein